MNEMIEGFLKAAKDDTKQLDLKGLMDEDEQLQWEILVKAMDSIDILNIGKDLEKISMEDLKKQFQAVAIGEVPEDPNNDLEMEDQGNQ